MRFKFCPLKLQSKTPTTKLTPLEPLLLIILDPEYVFRLSINPQMYFSLVNLVHKITNKRSTKDVFAI